jgi:hypothetical protein
MWLSHGGRLVLIKSILESIPVYWMSLPHIPKGILNKIKRKCSHFLWIGKQEKEEFSLVKWSNIANINEAGGWGLKNICIFK